MAEFSYLTVKGPAEGLYKEKGSKFMSFVYPVHSEEEVKSNLDLLRRKYHDARHHCFAWVIGADKTLFRTSDDGEPNHSAGDPILGQMRSRNLTNVLVVVVRYFGGTKLGMSGLIVAYRTAAQDALNRSLIIEKELVQKLTIKYDYASTPEVMRLLKDYNLTVVAQDFQAGCVLDAEIKLRLKEELLEKIKLLSATGTSVDVEFVQPFQ